MNIRKVFLATLINLAVMPSFSQTIQEKVFESVSIKTDTVLVPQLSEILKFYDTAYMAEEHVKYYIYQADTPWSARIVQLFFEKNYADSFYLTAFHEFKIRQNNWKPHSYFHYYKPGGLILFDKKNASITLVSFNFCANPKKVDDIRKYLIKSKKYKGKLLINCGSYHFEKL